MTRSYESSGPDVKIRGTAHHIGEKYLQLARDAQSSGDPVTAESYLQHAEHYFRLIAVAQQAQQQGAAGYQRQPGEAVADEIDDDDFTGIPDRFASPMERFAGPQPPAGPPQPSLDRGFYVGGGNGVTPEKQGFERPDRGPRQDRPFQDKPYGDRPYQDRPYSERQDRNGQDRNGPDRYGQDRNSADRNPLARDQTQRDQGSRDQGSRDQGPRDQGPRDQGPRDQGPRDQGPRDQGLGRDQDRRGPRGPRDFRNDAGARDQGVEPKGLPSFITAPVRAPSDSLDAGAAVELLTPAGRDESDADREPNGFHLRPRRRRRSKAEMAIDQASGHESNEADTSAEDPVGD